MSIARHTRLSPYAIAIVATSVIAFSGMRVPFRTPLTWNPVGDAAPSNLFDITPTSYGLDDLAGLIPNVAEYRSRTANFYSSGLSTGSYHVVEFPVPTGNAPSSPGDYVTGGHSFPISIVSWSYQVGVVTPNGLGTLSGTTVHAGSVPTSDSTSDNGVWYEELGANVSVPVQIHNSDAISSGDVNVVVELSMTEAYTDTSVTPNKTYHRNTVLYHNRDYYVHKLLCDDASVDERKEYGDPQKDGSVPADANADLRNVNFGDWEFKGGIFAGCMPAANGDRSGNSRIQLYVSTSSSGTAETACLSMFDLGAPPSGVASGSFDLGLFFPSGSDANIGTTETGTSGVRWNTRWSIDPSSSTDRIAYVSLGTANEYENWPLKRSTDTSFDSQAFSHLCLASNIEGGSSAKWRYFSSKEYRGSHTSSFPLDDSQPRLWRINHPETSFWFTQSGWTLYSTGGTGGGDGGGSDAGTGGSQ